MNTPINTSIFSVVIPTYHRNDLLAKCLDCLAPGVQTLASDHYEVIVTDDGSQTTAEAMIREQYPWAKWIAGPRKGPAANRNNGTKIAQGEWLAFTDDDCLPDTQWLEAYNEAITGTALALEGAIYPLGNLDQDLTECPVNLTGGCFWSANIAVKKELFERVNGFDQCYPLAAHEDQDLKTRLEKLTKISFVAKASVYHPVKILSLKEVVLRIPERCSAFAYHTAKSSLLLEQHGLVNLAISQYKFHAICLARNFRKLWVKNSLVSILMLIFGIPLILVNVLLGKLRVLKIS
jgi:GT2 family glycosyltransferase